MNIFLLESFRSKSEETSLKIGKIFKMYPGDLCLIKNNLATTEGWYGVFP